MKRRILTIILSVTALILLAGCAPSKPEPQTVQIKLTEFGIESSITTFKVGQPYHFVITNSGEIPHEIMIMKPLDPSQMDMDMEEMDKMALTMVEEDDLGPGTTETLDYTFDKAYPSGTLEFACHAAGHYEAGMKEAIVVEP